jgi:hypothetical protein
VARRRVKKSLSPRDDKFRQSVFKFAGFVDEYKYIILLGAAVIVLFSIAFYIRSERRTTQTEDTIQILTSDVKVSADELKELAQKSEGSPLEPWLLLAYGNRLFELYQEQDITKGDKTKLLLAQKAFEHARDRSASNGSAHFCALKSLETVQEELGFELKELKEEAKQPETTPADQQKPAPESSGSAASPDSKRNP